MKVEHNISRLRHLMQMYRLSEDDLLQVVSEGLKKPLNWEDIFGNEITLNNLKRLDKLFNKGLHYYLDPAAPETSKDTSIFFRKQNFVTNELSFGAVKIVNEFEEQKLSLESIARLSDVEFTRIIQPYSTGNSPKEVAGAVRKLLYPQFTIHRRDFLKSFISNLADYNILVFEFVETWNKKEKANIDGFFLKPNAIVLKRHQAFRREIFTLAHELGHYLLDEEEIERLEYNQMANRNLSGVERWCNDFAYFFLAGEYADILDALEKANSKNDYHFDTVEEISRNTHLSELALFTRLLYQNQLSATNYNKIKSDYDERHRLREEEKEREKLLLKEQGIEQRGAVPKPISSPLFISTIQSAYYEGILNEYEVSKRLKIKPEKLDQFIQ
ncbi:ImmA/IrrE family metallo-endopeptidase [Catalinimonas sp. 4WD22]|uniref:ImmA/IrrE family metallo-endopeptidase n=1 Tax=Catalinimonas locisalis TaxID=3133978 RepID=UPI003101AFBC